VPGPPPGFRRTIVLADGREVQVAPLTPAYAPELDEALRHADPDTLYRRFCGPPPRVTPALRRGLNDIDYRRRFALVARDPVGHGVAVARYQPTPDPKVAEVAVAVDPAWRRVGLATACCGCSPRPHSTGAFGSSPPPISPRTVRSELLDEAGGTRVIADGLAEAVVQLRPLVMGE
jgi:hypothetical protein